MNNSNKKGNKNNKIEEFSRTVERKFIEEVNEIEREEKEKEAAKKQKALLSDMKKQEKAALHKRSGAERMANFSKQVRRRLGNFKKRVKQFFRIIFHPKTTAQLALAVTIFILLAAGLVLIVARAKAQNFILPTAAKKSVLDQTGEAQLLDSFSNTAYIPENPLSIRLDGLLIQKDDVCYATMTVDGVTATFIENDYIGPVKIKSISAGGVVLDGADGDITLNFANTKYEVGKE